MESSSAISIQLVADSVVGCDSGLTIYTREGPIARQDDESDADVLAAEMRPQKTECTAGYTL